MLAGLSPLELGRLRMSVGYGTHKKGRPLSPVEVGLLLDQAREAGVPLKDCAHAINLDGTGHIGRFLRILKLPQDIQHLIDWGSGKAAISFSSAVGLVQFQDTDDQHVVAGSILEDGLNSREVRQVAQLRMRSRRTVHECLKEVLGMRPTIERRYVFIGSVVDRNIEATLSNLTQAERDSILNSCIEYFDIRGASGRLGKRFFTLVGDERFNASMSDIGKENIEDQFRSHIAKAVENAGYCC